MYLDFRAISLFEWLWDQVTSLCPCLLLRQAFSESHHLAGMSIPPIPWPIAPPQTATHILIRHIQSVWAIGMLSQGHMGAPLHHYSDQVGPRFVKSGSLVEWNNAITSWLRPSILGIYNKFELLACCLNGMGLHSITVILAKVAPDFGIQVHLSSEMMSLCLWG